MTTSAGVPAASGCQEPDPADPVAVCGAAVAAGGLCLAHLKPEQREAHLAALAPGADIDARSVTFTRELLKQLQAALTDGITRGARFGAADFSGAAFAENVNFHDAVFSSRANFIGARFSGHVDFFGAVFSTRTDFNNAALSGNANFRGVVFSGEANFPDAVFSRDANFPGATFSHANFAGATFSGRANFLDATFSGEVAFGEAAFSADADFSGATFSSEAEFYGATFSASTDFSGAAFSAYAGFGEATFSADADFSGATFSENANFNGAGVLGSVVLRCRAETLDLSGVQVDGELVVEVAARQVSVVGMRGSGRVALRLRGAQVDAGRVAFTGPFTVQGLQDSIVGVDEAWLALADAESGVPSAAVTSLRGADAERLVLTDMDLSQCLFTGMHRIEQLRLDGQCTFAQDPRGRRQVLAEEHHWRSRRPSRRHASWIAAPDGVEVVGPARLEVLYRQLRKAIEDSKNEPGAADFYYGEMEMRRAAATRRPDKTLLWLYWASSGYALRARRALAWLAIVIAATITALTLAGFPTSGTDLNAHGTLTAPTGAQPITVTVHQADPVTPWSARAEKATEITLNAVIFRGADTQLTTAGRYIDILARLLGPLLLGLSVLAVRNQVKR